MSVRHAFTLLGTGASTGIPVIGCRCPTCISTNPCDKRLRCSAWVQVGDKSFLIDPGPDIREQALHHGIDHLDGVLVTHTHYDHIGGIDELRIYYFRGGRPLPCLLSKPSLSDLEHRYYYMFRPRMHGRSLSAQLDFHPLPSPRGTVEFEGVKVQYLTYEHSGMEVTGYRFGDLAYICDIFDYPESIFDDLKGLNTLVLSALRTEPSPVHLTVEQAVAFAKRVGAKETWLTHIGHELEHEAVNATLPNAVRVAYDGLRLEWA